MLEYIPNKCCNKTNQLKQFSIILWKTEPVYDQIGIQKRQKVPKMYKLINHHRCKTIKTVISIEMKIKIYYSNASNAFISPLCFTERKNCWKSHRNHSDISQNEVYSW